ncbi:MAG: sodium/proton-translocating pyrophosphatase [Nitrospiraceae bacterium]
MSDSAIITFALIAAAAGIAYGLYLAMWVFKLNAGNAKMQEIAKAIQEGASAYMNRRYRMSRYGGGGSFRGALGSRSRIG